MDRCRLGARGAGALGGEAAGQGVAAEVVEDEEEHEPRRPAARHRRPQPRPRGRRAAVSAVLVRGEADEGQGGEDGGEGVGAEQRPRVGRQQRLPGGPAVPPVELLPVRRTPAVPGTPPCFRPVQIGLLAPLLLMLLLPLGFTMLPWIPAFRERIVFCYWHAMSEGMDRDIYFGCWLVSILTRNFG